MDSKDFENKLKEKFPDENYIIIYAGKNTKENSVLKCVDCGRRIEVNTGELFRSRRKHICSKCHYKRIDTFNNEQIIRERLKNGYSNITFFMEERKGIRHNMVSFTCDNCHRVNTKEVANFLRQKFNCSYCEGSKESKDTDIFLQELKEKSGDKFILLTEYINAKTDITIKCNKCGFIRKVKPNVLLNSCFCPKCDKKESRGEKFIWRFLENHNIYFIPQMYFSNWNIGIHYFDFYIPSYNLVLEYNGIQHYYFTPFFHQTEENFQYNQEKDRIKKDTALQQGLNYISIKYDLFDNLEEILNYIFNSTTIPEGSRGKSLEIETIQDIIG